MFRLISLVLIFFPAQILSTWKFSVSESITKRFFNLNYFRTSRQIHPVFSNDETINFDQVLSRKDMLSNICDDLFMIICNYLDSASLLILRSCNKELLKGYTQVMNLRFMKQLQPRISFDPRLFEEKRLASTFLNSFNYYFINLIHQEYLYYSTLINTLSTGQKEELDVVIADLSRPSNNFENFLRLAILFYNYTDAIVFWNLIEASMKSDILHLSDLNFIPQINYKIAFESACDWGLQNLSKELLMRVEELSLDLVDGCVRCINNGEHIVLKNILKSVLKLNYFNPEMIKFLLETSIKKIELESVEILFQHFDFLRFMDTDIIFWIIKNKNYPLLEILLKYRGDVDFTILDEDEHSPFDISAQHDFWQGIDSMSHVYRYPSIKIYSQALVFAILNQNYLSLQSLIFEINRKFGSFSSALKKAIIIGLIMDALKTRNLSILKLILINSPRNILIIERDLAILLGSAVVEYFLNPLFRTWIILDLACLIKETKKD
jgi:hypothetical protein